MKIGTEVEGRFKGLRTLFVTVKELRQSDFETRAGQHSFHQLYISDVLNELDLNDQWWIHRLSQRFVVTVERTRLRRVPPPWLNVILKIEVDEYSFEALRRMDQIKFEYSPLTVAMITKEQMVFTNPDAYEEDKTI